MLPEGLVLLDGGLATELEARGHDLSDALWSARLLADAPDEIVAAHTAFFRAGAQVAITASYQASFPGLAAAGYGTAESAALLRRSVELARRAAEGFEGRLVAASVGPYGAYLADGSEYRGRYGLTKRELVAFHRPRIEALAEAGPDLLALETVPDVIEAEALLEALETTALPAWLSYTVEGGHTRAGQPLSEAFAAVAGHPRLVAAGVNCCAPEDVPEAAAVAREAGVADVVAYPNSGEIWNSVNGTWAGSPRFGVIDIAQLSENCVRLFGGCCRVRPTDIARLAHPLGLT